MSQPLFFLMGPYIVHQKLWDTTYQLRELDGTVMQGAVAANHLKIFYYRKEHQTVRTVDPAEYALHAVATSSSSTHTSVIIGTLNQAMLPTPLFPVSMKPGVAFLPENRSLSFQPTLTPSAFTSQHLHHRYHPNISELDPTDDNPIRYVCYNASSVFSRDISMKLSLEIQIFATSSLGLSTRFRFVEFFFP